MTKLRRSFFVRPDVLRISRDLLGKHLFTRIGGRTVTGGIIVETEAYGGAADRASHAYGGRRTARNRIMYAEGGVAYVYLCYGVHALFNIVTNVEGMPQAVLIRAVQPTHGIERMRRRRGRRATDRALAAGPGALTRALGIRVSDSGEPVTGNRIWLEDRSGRNRRPRIVAGPRVGVAYAGKDAKKPWRFLVKGNPWTSRAS